MATPTNAQAPRGEAEESLASALAADIVLAVVRRASTLDLRPCDAALGERVPAERTWRRRSLPEHADLTADLAAEVVQAAGVASRGADDDRRILDAAASQVTVGPRPRPTAIERLRMAEAAGYTVSPESWPAARRRSMPPRIIRQDSKVKITARSRASVPPQERPRSSLPGRVGQPVPRPTALERLALAEALGYTVEDGQYAAARRSMVNYDESEFSTSASSAEGAPVRAGPAFAPKPRKSLAQKAGKVLSKLAGRAGLKGPRK